MDRRGWRVFAGVRRDEDGRRLREQGSDRLEPILLDVTQPDTITAAADEIAAAVGGMGLPALVNNAGVVVPGPLGLVPPSEIRRQFEVNVIGPIALIQALLPLLRLARGRIVGVGSIAGLIAPPYLGAYAASKFALEAMTDVLRVELAPCGIHVALVEPDSVDTPIWSKVDAAADNLEGQFAPEAFGPWRLDLEQMRTAARRMDRSAMPVAKVVRAVVHALTSRRPRTRYPLGWRTRLGIAALPVLSDRIRDWFVRRSMGIP